MNLCVFLYSANLAFLFWLLISHYLFIFSSYFFCTQELYHELHALDRFEHDYRLKQKEQDGLSSRGQFHLLQMQN